MFFTGAISSALPVITVITMFLGFVLTSNPVDFVLNNQNYNSSFAKTEYLIEDSCYHSTQEEKKQQKNINWNKLIIVYQFKINNHHSAYKSLQLSNHTNKAPPIG